ncbi:MAG: hypothetical protein ABI758_06245 [Candidatus Woesebacteria bacterium]
MNYIHLKESLKDFVVFSLPDIRQIEPTFDRRRLFEWQKKGYIKKLRRGYYAFSDINFSQEVLFAIANRLYAPSYISLESALSYYGLIPEGVYQLTSVCSRKTIQFETSVGPFSYQTVKPNLLFGYELISQGSRSYKIASREKAILDYLYLHPQIVQESDFHEWRFNAHDFLQRANVDLYQKYAISFGNETFSRQAMMLLDRFRKES